MSTQLAERPVKPPAPPQGQQQLMLVVARHELVRLWRSTAFWSSTIVTALILCLAIAAPVLIMGERDPQPSIGLVGAHDSLAAALVEHATVAQFTDADAARTAVRDGEVDAVVMPDEEIIVDRTLSAEAAQLLRWAFVVSEAADQLSTAGQSELVAPTPLRVTALTEGVDRLMQRTLAAGGGVLLLALLMILFGNAIAHNVAEEKSTRIAELLIAKVRPWQLLAGKILGVSTAALGPVLLLAGTVYGVAVGLGVLIAPAETLGVVLTVLLWFIPAFVLFTTVYAVAGALVGGPEDVGHVTGPVMLVQMVCLVGPMLVISEADRLLLTAVSLLPGFSWATMPVRAAYEQVPWWQHAVGYLLMLAAIVALVRFGGRVYRGGLLQHGGVIKVKDALSGARAQEQNGGRL